MSLRIKPAHAICAILLSVCAAFYPCAKGGFSNWDDARYVENNPQIKSLAPGALVRMFTSLHGGVYKPVTTLSFAIDYKLFGLNAAWYHAENIAWHAANALLVFLIASLLLQNTGAALFVALLFALHPMHAESAAWISERKDMLYAFFMLLSTLLYLHWKRTPGKTLLTLSVAAFLLSLMAKPMGITLPLILLALDYFDGRKPDIKAVAEKWPYFALSVLFGLLTLFTVTEAKVYFTRPGYTAWDYICSGFYGLLFYTQRLFLPTDLSAIYPFPAPDRLPLLWKISPLAVPILFGAICWVFRRSRETLAACAIFLISLAPSLQWIPLAPSLAFDHYTYIAYLGPFLLAGKLTLRCPPGQEKALAVFSAALLALYLAGTHGRCSLWADDEALWGDAIAKQPSSTLALLNRAEARIRKNDLAGAETDLNTALRLEPRYTQAYANRGTLRFRRGQNREAMEDFSTALKLDSRNTVALIGRGAIHAIEGKHAEALRDFDRSAELDPYLTDADENAAGIFLFRGDTASAIARLEKVLALKNTPGALALMAQARLMNGESPAALESADAALRMDPQNYTAMSVRGAALFLTGHTSAALRDLEDAARLNPAGVTAHIYRSLSLAALGRCVQAKEALSTAKALSPSARFPEADTAVSKCGERS